MRRTTGCLKKPEVPFPVFLRTSGIQNAKEGLQNEKSISVKNPAVLRLIIAGGKYFMHMGILLVTVDVFAPNLIG